jgi:hypothetical protein
MATDGENLNPVTAPKTLEEAMAIGVESFARISGNSVKPQLCAIKNGSSHILFFTDTGLVGTLGSSREVCIKEANYTVMVATGIPEKIEITGKHSVFQDSIMFKDKESPGTVEINGEVFGEGSFVTLPKTSELAKGLDGKTMTIPTQVDHMASPDITQKIQK